MILFRARTVLDKSNGKLVKNYYKQTSRMPDIWMVNIIRRCSDLCKERERESYQIRKANYYLPGKLYTLINNF